MPVILFSESVVVQESPRESLIKDSYFVSGRGIGSGSGIVKRFKDPALDNWISEDIILIKTHFFYRPSKAKTNDDDVAYTGDLTKYEDLEVWFWFIGLRSPDKEYHRVFGIVCLLIKDWG